MWPEAQRGSLGARLAAGAQGPVSQILSSQVGLRELSPFWKDLTRSVGRLEGQRSHGWVWLQGVPQQAPRGPAP